MKKSKLNLTLPLAITFVLMVLVVIYTSALFYRISVSNVYEVGKDKISGLSASLGNYLDTTRSVLWVTADAVDYMAQNGASEDIIQDFLVVETQRHKSQFDENYTGLYGYIGGHYYDGLEWVPPEDYDPTQRDWYRLASQEDGLVIVPPYIDAQTGSVVITVCKHLTDSADVVALDMYTNHVQDIIETTEINGKGYALIVDKNGTIIAHSDASLNGTELRDLSGGAEFMDKIMSTEEKRFETTLSGKQCTVFADTLLDQWHVVIVVGNDALFQDVYSQLAVNVVTNTIVFLLIALFYSIAYRREQRSSQEAEALKISEQQKEYEAQILRLEKSTADASNKAKSEFLAQMSHEIRTPINAVLGMNEMIYREANDPKIVEYSDHIRTAGRNLLSIINSILDFSKIEDGKMEIVPVKYDTASVIDNLVYTVAQRASDKGLELITQIDETLPAVMVGDDIRLTQIITNLLTNAVKYTEQGAVTLTIRQAGREGDSVSLYVEVKDTGIGIRDEDREKLFESFSRLDQQINHHIEGTGLGMSIVTALLSMMGSELQLESRYGEGSTFFFTVQQQAVGEELLGDFNERYSKAQSQKAPEEVQKWDGARVLVTDDNDINLKVAANLLRIFGIKPDLASSGKEAVELMQVNTYHLLLLDHMMPEMDGVETLHKLREASLTEQTEVVALTANAVSGARESYLEMGFDDYLSKPIEVEKLEAILKKHLPKELRKSAAAAPAGGVSYATEQYGDDEILIFAPTDEEETPDAVPDLQALEQAGICTEDGISYCGNDAGFYLDMLRSFVEGAEKRCEELEHAYAAADYENYSIYVHALKSAMRTLGIPELPAAAQALEQAAKEGDAAFVAEHHAPLMAAVREKAGMIAQCIADTNFHSIY